MRYKLFVCSLLVFAALLALQAQALTSTSHLGYYPQSTKSVTV